jgi:hypothetical protein
MEFLLIIALIVAFPIYILVKFSDLSATVARLQRRLDLLEAREKEEAEAHPREITGETLRRIATPVAPPAQPRPPALEPTPGKAVEWIATPQGPKPAAPIREVELPDVPPPTPAPTVTKGAPPPPLPPTPPLPPVEEKPAPAPFDWESLLGANWLSKLGIAALVVAAAFFLKYAIGQGWLGPHARVAIGLAASAILLGLGQWLLAKPIYRTYAQVLSSGGIIIFFLSIYAAYNFYQLMPWSAAFALLALGAVAASALAAANNTQAVAMLCLAGAFLTPILIHESGVGPGTMLKLYGYLALLNTWSVVLSQRRRWYSLTALAFGATWIIFLGAGIRHGPDYLLIEGFAVLFLLFAMYGGTMTMQGEEKTSPESEHIGLALLLGGALAFAVASVWILADEVLLGLPCLVPAAALLALLLAGMAIALPALSQNDAGVRSFFRYLSAVALAVLMAVAFLAAPATPRAQVPLAFVFVLVNYLLFLGVSLHMARREEGQEPAIALLVANALVHVIAVFRLLVGLRLWGYDAAAVWLPLAGAITLSTLWATPQERLSFRKVVAIVAQLFPLIAVLAFLTGGLTGGVWRGLAIFGAEFLIMSVLSLALRSRLSLPDFRGDLLAAVATAFLFFGLLSISAKLADYQGFVLLCGCALLMALYHAGVGVLTLTREDDRPLRQLTYLGLALTFVTIAVPLQLRGSALTVAWAAESAVLVWTGASVRDRRITWYGLVLFFVTAAKALFMDLPLSPHPFVFLLNRRLLSGAAVIAAAFVSAHVLGRRRGVEEEKDRTLPSTLALTALFFALVFLSFDLWQYAGILARPAGEISAQNFALSVYWALLAAAVLAVGLSRGNLALRVFALVVLGVTLAKVLLVDLFQGPDPYHFLLNTRFLAGFVALAVAAAAALLLWRRKEEITETEAGLPAVLAVLANLYALVFLSLEIWQFVGLRMPPATRASAQQLSLSIFWCLYALGGVSAGFWKRTRPVRLFSMGLLYLSIAKVFVFDLSFLQELHRIFSFLGLGIILLLVSLLYTRFERQLR